MVMSALRVTVVEAVSQIGGESGTLGDWFESVAVFEMLVAVEDGLICARIRIVLVTPEAIPPNEVEPVQEPPPLGSQGTPASTQNVAPLPISPESVSFKVAADPSEGPLFLTVTT